jgi:hypothetical protein
MSVVTVSFGIVSNILSVVGIVLLNKYITEVDGYDFIVFLSFLHFAFTSVAMHFMLLCNAFTYAPVTVWGAMPVAMVSMKVMFWC